MDTAPPPVFPGLILSLLLASALASCRDARGDLVDPDAARHDHRALRIKIVKINDNFNRDWCSEPRISHVVEVEVLDGPAEFAGSPLSLPYDAFSLGKEPPAVGTEIILAPADWLQQPATLKFRMRER